MKYEKIIILKKDIKPGWDGRESGHGEKQKLKNMNTQGQNEKPFGWREEGGRGGQRNTTAVFMFFIIFHQQHFHHLSVGIKKTL